MERTRPVSVTVLAIMHFVLGGLGLVCDLCGTAQIVSGSQLTSFGDPRQAQQQQKIAEMLEARIPAYSAYQWLSLAVSWLLSFLLIAGGIGLMQMQMWGRMLSLLYTVLSLLHKVIMSIYMIFFVVPIYKDVFIAAGMPPNQAETMQTIMLVTSGIVPLIMMTYPIVVLVFMLNPRIATAFREVDMPDEQLFR